MIASETWVLADVGVYENLPANAENMGAHALNRMHEMMQKHRIVGAVRGLGLLMGIELVKDRQTKEPAVDEAEKVMYGALARGLNFKVTMGNIITLTPPLTITKEEIDRAMDILDECLDDVEEG